MKRLSFYLCFYFISFAVSAQPLSVESIFQHFLYRSNSIDQVIFSHDAQSFFRLMNAKQIVQFNTTSGSQEKIILDLEKLQDADLTHIFTFQLNEQAGKILFTTNPEKNYRHSTKAETYVYDYENDKLSVIADNEKVQEPLLSPDGFKVAYVMDNNLFYHDMNKNQQIQITFDGEKNKIINGLPDWVYEEEFSFSRAFEWSPSGNKIAFCRFDESKVPLYNLTFYNDIYPEWYSYKYPKAGEENSSVQVYTYLLEKDSIFKMETEATPDEYIPRIRWAGNDEKLAIIKLNRPQNHVQVYTNHAKEGLSKLIYEEKSNTYISEVGDDFITFADGGKDFIVRSERSGFSHYYLYAANGDFKNAITSGEFDTEDLLYISSEKNDMVFYSKERGAIYRDAYRIKLNGTNKMLMTPKKGMHTLTVAPNGQAWMDEYSNATTPPEFAIYTSGSKEPLLVLENNVFLKNRINDIKIPEKEFITIELNDSLYLNAYMIKPPKMKAKKKYPLLVYMYGGPESQLVLDEWQYRSLWFQYLAEQGYVVVCADNRGTDGRGVAFRKSTYMQLGELETEDQLSLVEQLTDKYDFIDIERVGAFGWSYGGYLSLLALLKGDGIYKMAISVAPVTWWGFYDTIYTERFMRKPSENEDGYQKNAPLFLADKLKGKLLLIHGSADDNVHPQNSYAFMNELIKSGKEFDFMLYPNRDHSIYTENATYHIYKKMTDYIKQNL